MHKAVALNLHCQYIMYNKQKEDNSLLDLVLKGGRILTGSENPWFVGDVGIQGGRIVGIGKIEAPARRTIDLGGLVACPGFIDMHSHSDLDISINPRAVNKLLQGITTEVTGNCGLSPRPENRVSNYDRGIAPRQTLGDFYDKLEVGGLLTNLAPLVGHGAIRAAVMGYETRKPQAGELKEMKALLEEALVGGAFGFSTGLIYAPGSYAKLDELIELAGVLRKYNGLYASHIRGESGTLASSVEEAIEIGRRARIKVQISHHKACGSRNWGLVNESLKLIEDAREEGIDVTCDQYPYTAGSTTLRTCIPPWAHEGGIFQMLERLRTPEQKEQIRRDIEEGSERDNIIRDVGWVNIALASVQLDENKPLEGMSLADIAELRCTDPFTTLFDLLIEEAGQGRSYSSNSVRMTSAP